MSIEKIAPLSHSPVDALTARPGAPIPVTPHPTSVAAGSLPAFEAGTPANFFDSISLPLPAYAQQNDEPTPAHPLGATYARESALANVAQLVSGRLPPTAIALEVAAMLRNAANDHEISIMHLIADTEAIKPNLMPSRNAAESRFSLFAPLLAYGDEGETTPLDIFLTRINARQWEAAVFRRPIDLAEPGFPYSEPPIDLYRLVIDPSTGQILASVAQQLAKRDFLSPSTQPPVDLGRALRAAMIVIAATGATFIIAKVISKLVALCFFVTALALVINVPIERVGLGKTSVTPSRRRRP